MSARSRPRSRLATGLAALALALPAGGSLAAQSAPHSASAALGAKVRARALSRVDDGVSFGQAADSLVREAQSAGLGEGDLARTLRLAGRLYDHAGELEAARRTLEEAGVDAYRAGQAVLAANMFLNAAQAAWRNGDKQGAWMAAERAGYVLRTSDVPATTRERILARIRYVDGPRDLQPPDSAGSGSR